MHMMMKTTTFSLLLLISGLFLSLVESKNLRTKIKHHIKGKNTKQDDRHSDRRRDMTQKRDEENENFDIGTFSDEIYPTNDYFSMFKNGALILYPNDDLLSNDIPDSSSVINMLRIGNVNQPQYGNLIHASNGNMIYFPQSDWSGTDSFTYTLLYDEKTYVGTATVFITVFGDNGDNDPVPHDDEYTLFENTLLTVDDATNEGLLANDLNANINGLEVIGCNPLFSTNNDAAVGYLNTNIDGSFTYDPPNDFSGNRDFECVLIDNSFETYLTTLVFIIEPTRPVDDLDAHDDFFTIQEDIPENLDVLLNDEPTTSSSSSTSANELIFITSFTSPSHGTLTQINNIDNNSGGGQFEYIPNPNFHGQDSFTYTIAYSDNESSSTSNNDFDTATVTITVNGFPHAVTDYYTTRRNYAISVSAENGIVQNDFDPDGDSLQVHHCSVSKEGVTPSWNSDGSFYYNPKINYIGSDEFECIIEDGNGGKDTSTVYVEMSPF